jgi:hypothetical protein
VEAVFTDGYQYHAGEGADGVFGPVLDAVTKACGPGKLKGITETNSKYISGRPAWFASAWNWATAHNLEACFVFWSARLPAFNWLPGDGAVITQLRKVRAASLA